VGLDTLYEYWLLLVINGFVANWKWRDLDQCGGLNEGMAECHWGSNYVYYRIRVINVQLLAATYDPG